MPGGTIQPFCEPVKTTSRSHASIGSGTEPRLLIASTRMRMSGRTSRIAFAIAPRSFVTPVEVSLCVTITAL